MKRLLIFTLLLLSCLASGAQDLRTLETKVADLLAAMPVHNTVELDKRMQEMTAMGPAGREIITAMIIPPGGEDDTKARFAVESYSRYLSSYGHNTEKAQWEEECIDAIHASGYRMVRSFFLSQLKYTGSERAAEFASGFITDKNLCRDALAVIAASDYPGKEDMLVAALQIESLPCPAAVLNELAELGSLDAVTRYLEWYTRGDEDVKKAALNAMAESAHPLVSEVLLSAAREVGFKWDAGGATAALVQYARNLGDKGAVDEMDEICGIVISNGELQYRVAALEAMVHYKGYGAIGYLLTEYGRGSLEYRHAIFELSNDIPGKAATRRWMEVYPQVNEIGKAELITMLGERGDMVALPLVKDALFCPSQRIRTASAQALVKLQGRDAVPELIDYIQSYETAGDQEAGYQALRTVTDKRRRDMVARALEGSGDMTKSTMILLLSSGGSNKYFDTVYKYCSSGNDQLRRVAVSELKRLAGPANQDQLIQLMLETDDADEIKELQLALAEAASMVSDKEKRADEVLKAMAEHGQQEKFIPVLAELGGKKALNTVLNEFEKGDAEMRRIAYDALTGWTDHSASGALYDICASGNKNYSDPAFFAYVEKVAGSPLNDKQRYEGLKKIMPYALTPEHEESIIRAMRSVRTESALLFLAPYLENDKLKQTAASSVISIVLPGAGENPVFTDTGALKLLKKAAGIIEGPESEYTIERINKYIESADRGEFNVKVLSDRERDEGFVALFNGYDLDNWTGNKEAYNARDGMIVVNPKAGSGGNLYTEKEYSDFILRFEFLLTEGANNGLGVRAPLSGDAAYLGMELQILDNSADIYANLEPYQYHGSVYGVIPARRGEQKPVGEWNEQEVIVKGKEVKVILNGVVIVDGDIADAIKNGTMDGRDHPGLKRNSGHIGFLGHGSPVKFRNIRIKDLSGD